MMETRVEGKPPLQKCLVPTCNRTPAWKGLCPECYRSAKRLVEAGGTTWEGLERMGLARVGSPVAGGEDNFMKAFKDKGGS